MVKARGLFTIFERRPAMNQLVKKHLITKIAFLICVCLGSLGANAQLQADFDSDKKNGCSPLTIQYTDQSNASNVKYYWTFGNGNSSTKKNPQAIYYAPGKYEVTLTITDVNSKTSKVVKKEFIEVFKKPVADFSTPDRKGCVSHTVSFSDKSTKGTGDINKWLWDFGDGATSTSQNPVHEYKFSNKFPVSLQVTDENGCSDKKLVKEYINVQKTPKVDFEANRTFSCTVPVDIEFTNKSKDTDGSSTYSWDFGDGGSSSSESPKHTFKTKGEYDISLTVTNGNGCKSTHKVKEYIYLGDIMVDFTASPKEGCVPEEVSFHNITKPKNPNFTYSWEFGDGGKSGFINTLNEYTKAGVYTVSLTVKYNGKCEQTETKTNYIRIGSELVANFTASDTQGCKLPQTILFTNKSKGAVKYEWSVESNTYSGEHLTYIFQKFGKYKVTLKASNFTGCEDTYSSFVNIEPIKAKIWSDKTDGCVPLTINFADTTETDYTIVRRDWDFGDGTKLPDGGKRVSHTYTKHGEYTVTLKITTSDGCTAETELKIKAGIKLEPDFKEVGDTFCNGSSIFFKNLTKNDTVSPINWSWLWSKNGDSEQFSNDRDGNLILDHDTGWYDVTLVAEHNGCIQDTTFTDQFYVPPPHSRYRLNYDTCKTDTVVLENISLMGTESYWYFSDGSKDTTKIIQYFPVKGKLLVSLITIDSITGCIDRKNVGIPKVERFVSAEFSMSGDVCAPSTIAFVPTSINHNFSYRWTDPDDLLDTLPRASRTFTKAGTYTTKLVVKDRNSNCADSVLKKITIKGPGITGRVSGKGGCAPVSIELTCDIDPDTLDEVYWMVGTEKVPVSKAGTIKHVIRHPGTGPEGEVLIRLYGVDGNGCSGVDEHSMKVNGPKNIEIDLGRFKSCEGQRFIFSPDFDGASQDGYTYLWVFGDGDSSTSKVVNHKYETAGEFLVQLFVTDSFGCVSEWRDSIKIKDERLAAGLGADSISTKCPPHFVQFFDRSQVPNREIVSWEWDFGDGVKSKLPFPAHNYLLPGNYSVKLKVVDSWGCTDSVEYKNLILVNGPKGDYSFENKSGCVPVTIEFKSTNQDAAKLEWDFGDGVVLLDQENPKHTYRDTGRFIPLLILSDSFGCTYTLPPIDTIYSYPYPKAGFTMGAKCSNIPVQFTNTSTGSWGKNRTALWKFDDGETDTGWTVQHQYAKKGKYFVTLEVATEHGCADTLTQQLDLKGIEADFSVLSQWKCLGSQIVIRDSSNSDTTINSIKWLINGQADTGKTLNRTYSKVGPVDVVLMVKDDNNCRDTLISSDKLVIGDTTPPSGVDIYRVTVEDDNTVLMEFEPSSASDFHKYLIDRKGSVNNSFEVHERTDTQLFDNPVNTLEEVYCYQVQVQNTCGKVSQIFASDDHCTIEAKAKGEINRVRVNWNAYGGWPVETYQIHRAKKDNISDYQPIGVVDGSTLEYVDTGIYCHAKHYYRIEAFERNGNRKTSFSDTCAASPIYINVVPPNHLTRATVEDDKEVLIEWKEAPKGIQDVKGYIPFKSIDGTAYSQYGNMLDANARSLLDKEVEVDDRSYFYKLRVVDECDDTSEFSNLAKTILLKASTAEDQRPFLRWSKYQGWTEKVDFYEIQIEEEDGSFVSLGNSTGADDTAWLDKVTDLNQRPSYCYRVIGHKEIGPDLSKVVSVSNVDCAPVVSQIHVPNAFTPNGDGLNEVFETPGIYIKEYHITIFNRWGEKLYESDNIYESWDGKVNGVLSELEAYVYVIQSIGVDGVQRNYSGTVTLIR